MKNVLPETHEKRQVAQNPSDRLPRIPATGCPENTKNVLPFFFLHSISLYALQAEMFCEIAIIVVSGCDVRLGIATWKCDLTIIGKKVTAEDVMNGL